MEIINLPTLEAPVPSAVALGFFDGCHCGHTALLRTAVQVAEQAGICPAVFTFSDGEAKGGIPLLTGWEERLAVFADCGIRRVYAAPFRTLRNLTPAQFVRLVLKEMCGARYAVCGENFRYGARAAGTAMTLRSQMATIGGELILQRPIWVAGESVSASLVRRAVQLGDVEAAALYLGRPYCITASVTAGKQLGRTIGIPTVNQTPPAHRVCPAAGVYATRTRCRDGEFLSVTNVGVRPTVEQGGAVNMETHLIGYSGDLYGETVTVEFLRYLRMEKRFADLAALQGQMEADIAAARETEYKGEQQHE